ncbi:MAG: FAD-dependent oxidoreductase, partial [Planctomycetes bacterium]|nr:FAD-dependent oxidoreductase [Planctomycetota bacterium]
MTRIRLLSSLSFALLSALACAGPAAVGAPRELRADVCVYGATSAGIVAAVSCRQQGLEVVLLDADGWVGGLTTSGLGATDVGNKDAIGGLSRSFYQRLRAH